MSKLLTCGLVAVAVSVWAAQAMASTAVASPAVVTVTAGKPSAFAFTLSTKTIKGGFGPGGLAVTFKVTNKGAFPHTFKVCSSSKGGDANACAGKGTPSIGPGKSASLMIMFSKAGTYEYLCTVPGHAAAGMKGELRVT